MIEIAPLEALNHHLARISKVLEDADGLLVYSMRIVVLGEGAVVHVGELACYLPVVEEVVDVNGMDVPFLIEGALVLRGAARPIGRGRGDLV